jgi:hypothetical protein
VESRAVYGIPAIKNAQRSMLRFPAWKKRNIVPWAFVTVTGIIRVEFSPALLFAAFSFKEE